MSIGRSMMAAVFILIVGALSAVACGGGDDDAGTSATATNEQSSSTAAESTTPPGGSDATAAATTAAAEDTQPADGGITAADTCGLLTQEEVADALGESVQEPTVQEVIDTQIPGGGDASVGGCGYNSESFASSISVTYWYAPGSGDAIEGMIALACGGKESISGLGDEACWYDDQHVQIQAASGGNFLDIFATMSGDASDVLLTLAEKAIGRM